MKKTKTIDSSPVPRLALTNTLKELKELESEEMSSKHNISQDKVKLSVEVLSPEGRSGGRKSGDRVSLDRRSGGAKSGGVNSKDVRTPKSDKNSSKESAFKFDKCHIVRRATDRQLSAFIKKGESEKSENFDPVIDEDISSEKEEFIMEVLENYKLLRNFDQETMYVKN
jgi:hypothetical protein